MFIACEDVKKLILEKNAQFVDVRTAVEFISTQLPESINIPLQELLAVAEAKLDKSKPVVVFCQSGGRSQVAMHILQSLGFTEVHNMGSYSAWV